MATPRCIAALRRVYSTRRFLARWTELAELAEFAYSQRSAAVGSIRIARRAREVERQRIASDFHDGPLQSFISLQMRLEILRKLLERDFGTGMDDLRDLQELALQQVK